MKEDGKETEEKATVLATSFSGILLEQATNECLVKHEPELSWNSEVHSRILRITFEGY